MLAMTIGEFLAAQAWRLVVLGLMLVCSGFFAGSETALFSLSRAELFALGRDPRRFARMVPALMRRPGDLLTTVLLGTNLVHILYFVVSATLIMRCRDQVDNGGFWASTLAVITFLGVVIASEIIPKTLANIWARQLSPSAAPVLKVLGRIVAPMQRFLMAALIEPLTRLLAPARSHRGDLSADEMAALLALSQKRGLIGQDETELLQEVLELTDLRAGDIMVPRVDVVAYEADDSPEGLLEIIRAKRITKIPVYERDLDHVVGVIYAKRLLVNPGRPLREILSPVGFVPESAPLERVLLQFRATRSQLGMVVDEYGGTAGLITLEDILEEIVGDIADPHEARRAPAVQQVSASEWLVDGNLPIHEWAEAFPTDLTAPRFSTVGGFVISLLGRIPRVGETADYRNVSFTVEAMQRRRIALLRVRLGGTAP